MAKKDETTDDFETFEAIPISKIPKREEQSADDWDNAALNDLIVSLGSASDVNVTVSHAGRLGKYEIIETYSVDELTNETIDALRQQYGAGVYRFRAKRGGASRPLWQKDYRFKERPQAPRSAPAQSNDQGIHAVLAPLLQAVQQQGEMLRALLQQQQQKNHGETDIDRLIKLKTLLDSGQPKTDPFEIFMKSMAITKDLLQPSEGSNSIDLIRDVVKGMTAYAPRHQQLPPAQPVLQAPMPQPKEKQEMPKLTDFAAMLYQRAASGEAPDAFARTIVEYVGTDTLADFIEANDSPDKTLAQRFIEFDAVQGPQHAHWINTFCGEVYRLVFNDE